MSFDSKIGEKIATLCNEIIRVVAFMDSTDTLPYAAYRIESDTPVQGKSGILAWNTTFSILVADRTLAGCNSLCDRLTAALVSGGCQLTNRFPDERDSLFITELTFKSIS